MVSDKRSDKDRRSDTDRRQFFYTAHVPERRSGDDRRSGSNRKSGTERRKHKRLLAKDLTFVKLNSENKEDIGELLDISKKGISLRHFAKEEKLPDYLDLSILSSGGDLIMDKVSFRTVSKTELVRNIPFSSIKVRRYGVQFESLTPEQTAQLDYFLLNYTLGEA